MQSRSNPVIRPKNGFLWGKAGNISPQMAPSMYSAQLQRPPFTGSMALQPGSEEQQMCAELAKGAISKIRHGEESEFKLHQGYVGMCGGWSCARVNNKE